MRKTTFKGQKKTTSPGHAKTTLKVKQRRPSRSNKDDLQGQTKTTFQVKDDLTGQTKTTFMAKQRRLARPNEDDLRGRQRRLIAKGRRPSPRRKTTFHFSHRLPMHLGFRPIKSDWARVCTPKQHPRPRHFPARGLRGPPPHQIMTTGTPMDPVVIRLGS